MGSFSETNVHLRSRFFLQDFEFGRSLFISRCGFAENDKKWNKLYNARAETLYCSFKPTDL